jgi:hypothetical protein
MHFRCSPKADVNSPPWLPTLCAKSGCEQVQQTAAYSMTSSARTSSEVGILSPSVFAAFKLRTISIFVDCCTGRSDGFSPKRIRPAYTPWSRCASVTLAPKLSRPPAAGHSRHEQSVGRLCCAASDMS